MRIRVRPTGSRRRPPTPRPEGPTRRDGGEGKAARREQHFARLDRDGDGRVGQSEFAAKSGHWIERIDADGDGAVSREEWRIAAERRKSKGSDPAPQ